MTLMIILLHIIKWANLSITSIEIFRVLQINAQTPTSIHPNINTNNIINNRSRPKQIIQITTDTHDDDQSEDDVDMTKPRKPRKPTPKTDASRSRSRSRKPRGRTGQNNRNNTKRK